MNDYTVMKNRFTTDANGEIHISQKRQDNTSGRIYWVQVR